MPETLQIGERYHRTEAPKRIYRIVRQVQCDRHPPHVALVSENPDRHSITIGATVLKDRRQWIPVE